VAYKSRFLLSDYLSVGGICFLLSVIYFFAYGFYGLSDTDQGFIQALSWRIVQGEIPYKDFIYVRPPLSLYLHSLGVLFPMPVLLSRLFFYMSCGLTVWLCTRIIQTYFDFKPIGISPTIFAGMAFVCSVHNYPPMPWHTTDGLLLAALGIYFITVRKHIGFTYLGVLCLLFSAFCKQSFYPLIVLGPALVYFVKPKQQARWVIISYLLSIVLLIGFLQLFASEWWGLFIKQTTGVTELSDLLQVGIVKYIKPLLLLILPAIVVWRLQEDFILPGYWKYLPATIYWLFFFGLLGLHVFKALTEQTYVPPSFGFSQAFFLLATWVAIRGTWINTKAYVALLALLAIAWCSGLSWGYATPMLFFTPVLFGFLYLLYDELEFRVPRFFYGGIFVVLVWVFALLYQYPYRASAREDTVYHAGEVFPKLKGIHVGAFMFEKCRELAALHLQYGDRFTVLPSFPQAHFLTETQNPLQIDWAHNAEIGSAHKIYALIEELPRAADYIFIERDKLSETTDSTRYGSLLSGHVRQHWHKVQEGEFFEVYQTPRQHMTEIEED